MSGASNILRQAAAKKTLPKSADDKPQRIPAALAQAPVPSAAAPSPVLDMTQLRLFTEDDVTGTPEEQLAFVTEKLSQLGDGLTRAKDWVQLNRGALLEIAQGREMHKTAGAENFAAWASEAFGLSDRHVWELIADAQRYRDLSFLGDELMGKLIRASARKVVADVFAGHGKDAARQIVTEASARTRRPRPTAEELEDVARELGFLGVRISQSTEEAPPSPHVQRIRATAESLRAKTRGVTDAKALTRAYKAAPEAVDEEVSAVESLLVETLENLRKARAEAQDAARAAAERRARRTVQQQAAAQLPAQATAESIEA